MKKIIIAAAALSAMTLSAVAAQAAPVGSLESEIARPLVAEGLQPGTQAYNQAFHYQVTQYLAQQKDTDQNVDSFIAQMRKLDASYS